jgi:hypothetical protein
MKKQPKDKWDMVAYVLLGGPADGLEFAIVTPKGTSVGLGELTWPSPPGRPSVVYAQSSEVRENGSVVYRPVSRLEAKSTEAAQ